MKLEDVTLPMDLIPPQVAAVATAVLVGARTTSEVAKACGWASTSTAHRYLKDAHALGLVVWDPREPKKDGTLRPGLGLVASSFGRNGFLGGRRA